MDTENENSSQVQLEVGAAELWLKNGWYFSREIIHFLRADLQLS